MDHAYVKIFLLKFLMNAVIQFYFIAQCARNLMLNLAIIQKSKKKILNLKIKKSKMVLF